VTGVEEMTGAAGTTGGGRRTGAGATTGDGATSGADDDSTGQESRLRFLILFGCFFSVGMFFADLEAAAAALAAPAGLACMCCLWLCSITC
jgi:hypothetical protein